jgi:hypothetical protein
MYRPPHVLCTLQHTCEIQKLEHCTLFQYTGEGPQILTTCDSRLAFCEQRIDGGLIIHARVPYPGGAKKKKTCSGLFRNAATSMTKGR